METASERAMLREIVSKIAEPAKYKIKVYQIAVLMYIDHIFTLVINKYMFFRVNIEQKTNQKILLFQQTQLKLDLKPKLNENLKVIVDRLNHQAKHGFGKNYFSKKKFDFCSTLFLK